MKISADTITAESVREIRTALAKASSQSFDLVLKIERSEITPEAAAVELAEILAPLHIESAPAIRYFRNCIGDEWKWDGLNTDHCYQGQWKPSVYMSPEDLITDLDGVTEITAP